jgi:von Willebrand factor type A domain
MKNLLLFSLILFSFSSSWAAEPQVESSAQLAEPKVQVAILIDTSSSMEGLINQTREQLWRIVNTLATAKREGKRARLELALYEYGNDSIAASNQYVRQVVGLTTDLDKVSEALFKLSTGGGEEYCGAVIAHASKELEWSKSNRDLKLIYIAGNESFAQGPVKFQDSVKNAIEHGIVVNTIHAGSERDGVGGQWLAAAKMADGHFLFIDQNKTVARIDAPQDAELLKLSDEMNKTYIAYGPAGKTAQARQEAQDANAKGASGSSGAMRATAKASAAYSNADWDIVDAKKEGRAAPAPAQLPAAMQKMSEPEREAFVATKAKERADIQGKIQKLTQEREAFVVNARKKAPATPGKTLDDAMIDSAKVQGTKQNFSF